MVSLTRSLFSEKMLIFNIFNSVLMPKNDFDSTNFANFEDVVHNFGRSEDDMI